MPLYEYTCRECGTHFDALRTMREADAPIACKHCQSLQTSRQLSVFFSSGGSQKVGATSSGGGGCGNCSGGSCGSCHH